MSFQMKWSDERFITTFISTDVRPLKEKEKQNISNKGDSYLWAKQIVSNEMNHCHNKIELHVGDECLVLWS